MKIIGKLFKARWRDYRDARDEMSEIVENPSRKKGRGANSLMNIPCSGFNADCEKVFGQ